TWLMNGAQVQGWVSISTVAEFNWQIEGTGDFNRDGKIDILWRNDRDGQIGTWLMNGTQVQGWVGLPTVSDLNWRLSNSSDRTPAAEDNSFNTARNLGVLGSSRQVLTDFVGSADTNDYYRFTIAQASNFSLSLTGLSADADVELFDVSGNLVTDSTLGSTAPESINRQLNAGTYYARVYAYLGDTNYTLTLSADAVPTASDRAGNSLDTALNLGSLSETRTFQEFVGTSDPNDYYQFTLGQNSDFSLAVNDLSADVDVQLLDSNGNAIASSTNSELTAESIDRQLTGGTYYVRVYPYRGNTNYRLTLSATPVAPPDGAGNSLSTARNLGVLNSSRSFQDYVGVLDNHDYYRFSLSQVSDFSLQLNGLSADADVVLLDRNGTLLQGSYGVFTLDESIARRLSAGDYYVRVYPYSGSTTYNLNLSAIAVANTDGAGNSLAAARYVGVLSSNLAFQDFVGRTDPDDYYRFDLSQASTFSLALNNLAENADVQLLNSAGQVIAVGERNDTTPELISQTLADGTYYIRVYPYDGANTNYQLTLTATAIATGFNPAYGYGLVNAAAAVARAIGLTNPFADVANLGGINWGNDMVNAPEVWARGYTGQGVTVAVVDTGVDYNHTDLNDNIWINTREIAGNGIDDDRNGFIDDIRGWDFIGRDNNPVDAEGHGTHVAGTIAAENNGIGVTGVAYNARIMAVRVLGSNGSQGRSVADGILYAVNNGARVINLSLGGRFPNVEIEAALQYATSLGAFVVMAAGNDSGQQPGYPAFYATQYGLSVGAVDINRTLAYFSNRAGANSAMQYVVGPGVNIYSTVIGNAYDYQDGTSMATPHIAGVVALMLSANPNLTHTQIREILTSSAVRLS
ncbi:MAG: S8 family serine peptidase, partial [Synechococcales bacterium]|nr:S8 family serine peptidase [Synechococcales bacterium]